MMTNIRYLQIPQVLYATKSPNLSFSETLDVLFVLFLRVTPPNDSFFSE